MLVNSSKAFSFTKTRITLYYTLLHFISKKCNVFLCSYYNNIGCFYRGYYTYYTYSQG